MRPWEWQLLEMGDVSYLIRSVGALREERARAERQANQR